MDAEVDRRDARDHADALARAAAAGGQAGLTGPVAARDVDEPDVRAHLIGVAAIRPGPARRLRRSNYHGVGRILGPLVHLVGLPVEHPLLGTRFGHAERCLHSALVLTDPLLLGAGEERSRD